MGGVEYSRHIRGVAGSNTDKVYELFLDDKLYSIDIGRWFQTNVPCRETFLVW